MNEYLSKKGAYIVYSVIGVMTIGSLLSHAVLVFSFICLAFTAVFLTIMSEG